MRRGFLSALTAMLFVASLSAQQITKFGVVDTAKVYSAYFKNSAAVRGYEKKKAEAEAEINKRTEEIRALKAKQSSLSSFSAIDNPGDGDMDNSAGNGSFENMNNSPSTGFSFPSRNRSSSSKTSGKTLDDEIARKTKELTEYAAAKNAELESMKKSMQGSDAFYKKLYAVIGKVAEQGGYSAILSLQQSNGVLWYSPSVDVTEDVIRALEK